MTPGERGWGPPGVLIAELGRVTCSGDLPMLVRRELVPLFDELVVRIETVAGRGFMTSSGGYNYRPKRKMEKLWKQTGNLAYMSEHAWGTAGDFRAGTNPGYNNKHTDFPDGTGDIAASVGLSWAGLWKQPFDPMHFEFLGSPRDAGLWVARLTAERILKTGKTSMAEFTDEEKNDVVRAARCIIRAFDTKQPSLVTPTESYWATQFLQFIDRATNATAKNMEELLRRVPPVK